MKRIFFIALVAGPGMIWAGGAAWAQEASVAAVEGSASSGPAASGPWAALKAGSTVTAGQYVKTEAAAKVEITLPDATTLRIGPGSTLRLSESSFKKNEPKKFSMNVVVGRVWASVGSIFGKKDRFEVSTGTAVAGVRGTTFRVDAGEDKSTLVSVYDGAVAVNNGPISKPDAGAARQEIGFPAEITKSAWMELIVARLQSVRIAADGTIGKPVAIDEAAEAKDEWVAWNRKRDSEKTKK